MKKLLSILLLSGTLALTGCGNDRDDFVVTNTNNNQVVTAPTCADDAYTTNRNVALTVAAAQGVLINDSPQGSTVTFQTTSANGGTIAGNQDGSFSYTPAANFAGTDTFTYTLGNSGGVVTCTVTITVNAVNGFFVDSVNGNDGTGNFTGGLPFASIQAAAAAAPPGSDIVVRPGNYTGGIALENGDRLLGNGSGLVINPQGAVRPVLSGPVVLADGNTVDFVRIANSPADAVDGDDQNDGIVTNCEIDTSTGSGVSAFRVSGNWNISNNVITSAGSGGVPITTEGASIATVRVNNNQISGSTFNAIGFVTSNTSQLNAQITGNTLTGNQANFTFEIIAGGTSTSCFDIENNTNDDTYRISANDANPTLQVEQFGNLITVNNNSGTVFVPLTAPTDVVDGTCGF